MRWFFTQTCLALTLLLGCAPCPSIVIGDARYDVAGVACTAQERRRGLSETADFGAGDAFVIVFPVSGEVCIQNATTRFDLDVLYLLEGRVDTVERDIRAGDGVPRCHQADAVVEILSGSSTEAGQLVEFEGSFCN